MERLRQWRLERIWSVTTWLSPFRLQKMKPTPVACSVTDPHWQSELRTQARTDRCRLFREFLIDTVYLFRTIEKTMRAGRAYCGPQQPAAGGVPGQRFGGRQVVERTAERQRGMEWPAEGQRFPSKEYGLPVTEPG